MNWTVAHHWAGRLYLMLIYSCVIHLRVFFLKVCRVWGFDWKRKNPVDSTTGWESGNQAWCHRMAVFLFLFSQKAPLIFELSSRVNSFLAAVPLCGASLLSQLVLSVRHQSRWSWAVVVWWWGTFSCGGWPLLLRRNSSVPSGSSARARPGKTRGGSYI